MTQLVRLDLDPDNMFVDENCVCDLGGCFEVISNGLDDEGLNLVCRDPADGAGLLGPALQQCRRDVIAVLDASLAGMARAHPMAAIIEDAAQ